MKGFWKERRATTLQAHKNSELHMRNCKVRQTCPGGFRVHLLLPRYFVTLQPGPDGKERPRVSVPPSLPGRLYLVPASGAFALRTTKRGTVHCACVAARLNPLVMILRTPTKLQASKMPKTSKTPRTRRPGSHFAGELHLALDSQHATQRFSDAGRHTCTRLVLLLRHGYLSFRNISSSSIRLSAPTPGYRKSDPVAARRNATSVLHMYIVCGRAKC